MTNQIFDTAIIGLSTKLVPTENGDFIMNVNCNQKFTLNTVMDLLKTVRSNKEIMAKINETDMFNEGLSFEMEFSHKKFTVGIIDRIKFNEIMEG
jgi:hypothetical protein